MGAFFEEAFPDDKHCPSQLAQFRLVGNVPGEIAVQLAVPKIRVGSRPPLSFAAIMTMPEATLHQDGNLVAW